ncbi:P-loop containing nucleoside triphosphate hydrolase protein, partial [Athelia psychrophila]
MSTIPPPFNWSERLTDPWHSDEGIEELRQLVRPSLPFDPYPFQLDCTARILDGQDVLCICETGGGKTALVVLPLIARRGTMSLMICPTNFLESDMARGLENSGVAALVINSESLARASLEGRDLWAEAKTGRYQMVLCGPETTVDNQGFNTFIDDPNTRVRLGCLVIDEIHLIYIWGPNFRKNFATLGALRARLPSHTVLVGLTATLEPGRETDAIVQSACFKSTYHFERRDCERRNVDIIFREIKYNISGYEFRDLDWLIDYGLLKASDILKCIIYCESIELGHRVTLYL